MAKVRKSSRKPVIALIPIAAKELPPPIAVADRAGWIQRTGYWGGFEPNAIAVSADDQIGIACGTGSVHLGRRTGGRRGRVAMLDCGEIVACGFLAGGALVVLGRDQLVRLVVTGRRSETTASIDLAQGAALAVQADGVYGVVLERAGKRKLGRAIVFDADLRAVTTLDNVADVRAGTDRLFAVGVRGKPFEIRPGDSRRAR